MRAGERAGTAVDSWVAAAGHFSGRMRARRIARAQRDERAKSARVAIVVSLFLVLLMAALLVGGHAVIDPLLQSAAATREEKRVGDIVYAMPDGTFCRHLAFDNGTAELIEGAIEQCPSDLVKKRAQGATGFAWGGR
jgi:hypothetical protein